MNNIKSFKGFNKDMTCRGFKYEEGKDYEESTANVCNEGFQGYEYPLYILEHYPPATSVYHEVEQSGEIERGDNTKVTSTKIHIGARLDIRGLVNATIEFIKSRTTTEHTNPKLATVGYYGAAAAGNYGAATAGEYGAATAGEYGAATAGNYGAATAGYCGAATAGNYGATTAGEYGAATAGYCGAATAGGYGAATAGNYGAATAGGYGAATAGEYGAATAGECGAATAGNYGAATAGNYGAATAGECGAATSRGMSASGDKGLSVARGNNVKVKGGKGAILVIAEEDSESSSSYDIENWKAVIVDGDKVKADTWYCLKNGKLTECE